MVTKSGSKTAARTSSETSMQGYCALCRAKEMELFGTLVKGKRHRQAVKEAGCRHPAEYADIMAARTPRAEAKPILRRTGEEVLANYNELWDKLWWNRHQDWLHESWVPGAEEPKEGYKQAMKAASRIERKYGKENLRCDGYEMSLLEGKMAALVWVMGEEWRDGADT
jgi:hypothetical protein